MPFLFLPLVGGIMGAAGSILGTVNKFFTGRKQRKLANKINPIDPEYQISQQAKDQLARAQQLAGGRMAGATAMEKNIAANQANFQASVERNAASGTDALAMAAVGNAQANQSMSDLAVKEAQNKVMMNEVLSGAENNMINQQDKVFDDRLRKYTEAVKAKNDLMNAAYQNTAGALSDMAQGGLMMLGSGANPKLGGLFGGMGKKAGALASVSSTPLSAAGMNPVVGGGKIGGIGTPFKRLFTPPSIDPSNTEQRWRSLLGQ
jgi:hypothetical protein